MPAREIRKTSIRFFDDYEVRAVWDDASSKWWFSVLDVLAALTGQPDYRKTRNYWKWLSAKLKKEGNELGSVTTQLKYISKGGFQFATARFLGATLTTIEKTPEGTLDEIATKYIEMNIAHPFMEGNGRSTRIWLDLILKKRLKKCVDWSRIAKKDYLEAMKQSPLDATPVKTLLKSALTKKIADRETFMKGVDYSYYYEEE